MRSVMEVFWEVVLGITGAIALSTAAVAGMAFGMGCVGFGCAYGWRNWQQRKDERCRAKDRTEGSGDTQG